MNNYNDEVHGVWDRIGASDSANHNATSDNNRLSGPMIGIDLGTSNSCVSLWHTVKNRAKIIKNSFSKSKCPVTPLECRMFATSIWRYPIFFIEKGPLCIRKSIIAVIAVSSKLFSVRM